MCRARVATWDAQVFDDGEDEFVSVVIDCFVAIFHRGRFDVRILIDGPSPSEYMLAAVIEVSFIKLE